MHAAIARAHSAIASGRYTALTLDIFETLVRRDSALPEDAAFLLGHRLRDQAADPATYTPALFAHSRLKAHGRAQQWTRQARNSTEPTLAEIYRHFPLPLFRGLSSADLAAAELAMEHDILRPDAEIMGLAAAAEAAGLTVALVSDTVFDAATLGNLVEHITGHRFHRIYSSCDYQCAKAQGLLSLVAEDLGLPPATILHVGDNDAADGAGASRTGTAYESLATPPFEDIIAQEQEPVRGFQAREPVFGSGRNRGDWGLTGLRRRLAGDEALADPYRQFGAVVAGPVLCAFAHWLADRVRATGADHVLFMMREGRLIKRLVDPLLPPGVASAEVFTSRYVTGRAALASGDPTAAERFLYRYSAITGRQACTELGLPDDIAADAPFLDELLDDSRRAPFVQWATSGRALRHVIIAGQRTRDGFLKHVSDLAAPTAGRDTILVDIGYNGSAQGAIQEIFNLSLPGARTRGLYLVTGEKAIDTEKTGAVMEGYLGQYGHASRPLDYFIRMPELLEQCMMADIGSVTDYTDDGTPVLAEPSIDPAQMAQIDTVQDGIAAFCDHWKAHLKQATGPAWNPATAAVRTQMLLILERMIMAPTGAELAAFGGWRYDENVGSTHRHSLAVPSTLDTAVASVLSPGDFIGLPPRQVYWLSGAAHRLRGPAFARRLRLIANGTCAASDMMSGHQLTLTVASIAGAGDPEEARVPVRIDTSGHALLRVPVTFRNGLHGLVIAGWPPGVIVRLHGLHVRAGDWKSDTLGPDLAPLVGSNTVMPQIETLLFSSHDGLDADGLGPCLRIATPMLGGASGTVEILLHVAIMV